MKDMMDPVHFRLWRVSWDDQTIQVYRDLTLVLSVSYVQEFDIGSVSVASDDTVGNPSTWELDNLEGMFSPILF